MNCVCIYVFYHHPHHHPHHHHSNHQVQKKVLKKNKSSQRKGTSHHRHLYRFCTIPFMPKLTSYINLLNFFYCQNLLVVEIINATRLYEKKKNVSVIISNFKID